MAVLYANFESFWSKQLWHKAILFDFYTPMAKRKCWSTFTRGKSKFNNVEIDENGVAWSAFRALFIGDETKTRLYTIFAGNDFFQCAPDPNSPAFKVIEEIYNNSIGRISGF